MKFCYDINFTILNNPKDLIPFFKMDLYFWDCFGRKKLGLITKENSVKTSQVYETAVQISVALFFFFSEKN